MSFLKNIFGKSVQVGKNEMKPTILFENQKNKIYPWVKVFIEDDTSINASMKLELVGANAPVYRKWLGDLAIFYVVDNGDNFRMLLKGDLPECLTEEELYKIAVSNLERDVKYKLHETNFGGYGLVSGGNHEAGAICVPGLWNWLAQHIGENLIIAIPAKDLVMIVPASNVDIISNLKIAVHETFKNGQRLLTRNLFFFDRESEEWKIIDSVH
jgi:uncharacterized protein YtpQ (UPF0354 family)